MRRILIGLWIACCAVTSAFAQVSIGIGVAVPGLSIGINLPAYPQLVQVSGYPVYYAPQASSNYFFYDGMYWVYQRDNWYASSWYNGPWWAVQPEAVPLFILRVPVRYYRQRPAYFRGWSTNAPPRWGEHWGSDWDQRHRGWDQWDRKTIPAPAPLPRFQAQYSGNRYPQQVEQQHELQSRNYRYEPREPIVQQHYQAQRPQTAPAPTGQARQPAQHERPSAPPDQRGSIRQAPTHQPAPAAPHEKQTKQPPGQDKSRDKGDKGDEQDRDHKK